MTLQLQDEGLAFNFRKAFKSAATTYNPYYRAAKFAYEHRKDIGKTALNVNPYYQGARLLNKTRFGKKVFGALPGGHRWGQMLNEIEGTPTYHQFLSETGLSGLEESGELAGKFGTWIKTKAVPGLQKIQGSLSPLIGLLPGGGIVNAAFDVIKKPAASGELPQPVVTPMLPAPIMPQAMPEQMAPAFPMAPAPAFFPQIAPASEGMQLPFGLDLKTLALLGVGGVLAYKLLKK
jgi:hypothetical protein